MYDRVTSGLEWKRHEGEEWHLTFKAMDIWVRVRTNDMWRPTQHMNISSGEIPTPVCAKCAVEWTNQFMLRSVE